MSAIRPDLAPGLPPPAAASASPARAAQAAFFRTALSEAEGASATRPAAGPEQPRPPRPGQLLDIRV